MVHNTEVAETILARFSQASDPEKVRLKRSFKCGSPFSWKGLGFMMKRLYYVLVVFALTLGWCQEPMAEIYSIQPVGKVVKRSGKTILEIFPTFKDALLGLDGFSHIQGY